MGALKDTSAKVGGGCSTRREVYEGGLHFQPASSLQQVIEAWQLVYRSYQRTGLIGPNPVQLHTVPHAIQARTAVICGQIQGLTVSTLTGYFDQPEALSLPLDSVYPDELDRLRRDKRVLMEIGLFADRREHIGRALDALLELMHHVCQFGAAFGATDGIVGVHPHHVPFYTRLLGFEQIGEQKSYSLVNDHPVVLLRLDWAGKSGLPKVPRGLRYLRDNPLPQSYFDQRFMLSDQSIAGSPIERYLSNDMTTTAAVA